MRALIDTNDLISYLLLPEGEGAVNDIIRAFRDDQFTLLLPEPLLQELTATVKSKPRLARRILPGELASFTEALATFGERVNRIEKPFASVTQDPKDDYLLAYALIGRADCLVTGDKDILAVKGLIAGLAIVTPSEFVGILQVGG